MIPLNIIETINSCQKIALAVSGGSDSMAMLHWFINNIDKSKFYVINIEHGIRGEESIRDSAFVQQYCKDNNTQCQLFSVNALDYSKQNKLTLEQSARLLRHDIFKQQALTNANYIALAHHKGDQAESIFMHIARGCGINGLCGMSQIDGYILRPLLHTDKKTIDQYIADHNIPFVKDSTNDQNIYSRNYTRNVILPTIQKVYPQFSDNLIKLGGRAEETIAFLQSREPILQVVNGCCKIDISSLPPPIAKLTLQRAIALVGAPTDIEEKHLNACIALLNQTNGARIMLPHNIIAYNENNCIALTNKQERDNSVYEFSCGEFNFIYGDYLIMPTQTKDAKCLLDADALPPDAVIRAMRKGDKIKLSYGTKSLGDYYTDKKIPKRLRGCIPIIASGNNVIAICDWAVGIDYANQQKTTNYFAINYFEKDEIYE